MASTATDLGALTPQEPAEPAAVPPHRRRLRLRRPRFLTDTKATIGTAVVAVFVLLAVIGQSIAPYDPSKRSSDLLKGPPPSTGSAPRTWARTCSARSWWAPAA